MAESISAKTAWALAKAIKGGSKKKLPNSGSATVVRIDQDGTHWVRISGSDVETPINGAITADARPGDVVQYRLEDTRISITGNATSPSVGKEYVDDKVEPVEAKVDVVARANALLSTATERARSVADAAKSVADAVNQHFFADGHGIHVTEATQEEWDESHTGANVLINSIGQLFRDGLNNLLTLTTESGARALTIWDGLGNTAEHVVATFAGDGIGLAGDAFHLASTKTTSQSGVEHVTSDMSMDSANSSYKVSSYITTNTYLSDQSSDLLGQMRLGLTTGDSTFSDIYEAPSINMYANASTSSLAAGADRVSVTADDQIELVSDQYVMEGVDGTTNTWSVPAGTVLWSASSGWQMAANVTATLNYNVSTCPSGIVLHWQAYANSATQDYDHVYTFVPKQHVVISSGKGVVCQLANSNFGYVGTKYVYVANGGITGHANNQSTGTANGITYANNHWVLTQVIAV